MKENLKAKSICTTIIYSCESTHTASTWTVVYVYESHTYLGHVAVFRALTDSCNLYRKHRTIFCGLLPQIFPLRKALREEDEAHRASVFSVSPLSLIGKHWKSEQSKANIANRERMYTKRRCGSRSIPVRVKKLAREKKMLPDLVELYKETHYNEKTHEWISSQAQCNYENMIQTQADHLSQPRSTPLTAEELSIKVLKPRSGYVKGLGMRSSLSIRRATTTYAETNDYVKRLEMQIETQKEQIQMQNNKIEDLEEGKKKQGEIMADVVNFLRTKRFTRHFIRLGWHF
ncbi:unnamed protein product [Camellia sinensis]